MDASPEVKYKIYSQICKSHQIIGNIILDRAKDLMSLKLYDTKKEIEEAVYKMGECKAAKIKPNMVKHLQIFPMLIRN